MPRLDGKVAVITGAGSGLGREASRLFASEGAKVVVMDILGQSYEEVAGPWDPGVSPIPLKLRRPPSLRDNAYAALYLVSDEAAYVTGVTLPSADGGTLARVAIQFEEDTPRPTL